MNFKIWLESVDPLSKETVRWWANYAANMKFPTEQAARDWLFARLEFSDRQSYAQVFGINGPEKNRRIADAMPIWQSGKSFKIGQRVRGPDNRLRLRDLEIRKPGIEELNTVAQSNGESDYVFHKVKWIPVSWAISDESDYYLVNQRQRIQNLANQIKENRWIEAVIYDVKDRYIIEGQHRTRAMYLLGFKTVPGIGIEYD